MKRRGPVLIAVAVLVAASLYLSFELGRYEAGFSLFDQRRQRDSHAATLADRDLQIEALQRQVARLETSRDIDEETYASIETNLGELQARIQAQEEELVFYRGIVSPGDGVAGLRIQNVEVETGANASTSYALRVLLVQSIVHSERVTGSIRALIRGSQDGVATEYGLDQLGAENGSTDIPYGFRYFQALEVEFDLPDGFEPDDIEIQVWPRSPRGETIVQSFNWVAVSL